MTTFSINLKSYREKANLTQEELGQRTGISQKSISAYEKGTRKSRYASLIKLSRFFGCSPDELDPVYQYRDEHYDGCDMMAECPLIGENKAEKVDLVKWLYLPHNRKLRAELIVKMEENKENAE